jgi:hypothetical protein
MSDGTVVVMLSRVQQDLVVVGTVSARRSLELDGWL